MVGAIRGCHVENSHHQDSDEVISGDLAQVVNGESHQSTRLPAALEDQDEDQSQEEARSLTASLRELSLIASLRELNLTASLRELSLIASLQRLSLTVRLHDQLHTHQSLISPVGLR